MKCVSGLVLLLAAVASHAVAGVGVWTPTSPLRGGGVVVGPDETLFEGCGSDVCKSLDHGNTWRDLAGPGEIVVGYPLATVLAVSASGAIYAAVIGGGEATSSAALSVSRDGGASWTTLHGPDLNVFSMTVSVDPFSADILLLFGFGIPFLRSIDGGVHWTDLRQAISEAAPFGEVTAVAFDPRTPGRVFAAAGDVVVPGVGYTSGLFASSDSGSTWSLLEANLPGSFSTLVVDPFRSSIIYGGGPGIFRSGDTGTTFLAQRPDSTVQIVADSVHSGRLYAATTMNGVLRSSDGGATWTSLNGGLPSLSVGELALDAANGYLYATTNSGVFVVQLPDPGALLLDAAHPFTVTLSATDPRTGQRAAGVPTQVNDLWGYFSIPAITNNPGNPEVFVKLLDGTAINGEFWFFYGGLTNLEYTLTVTDATTGASKTYTKPGGSVCGGSDTAAFTP